MALRQDEVIPRIEYARRELGLSQNEAYIEYRMAGGDVSMGSFERWHRGVNAPPADEYEIVARVYDAKLKGRSKFRVFGKSYWVSAFTGDETTNRTFAETAA